jgi:hypothetical protein
VPRHSPALAVSDGQQIWLAPHCGLAVFRQPTAGTQMLKVLQTWPAGHEPWVLFGGLQPTPAATQMLRSLQICPAGHVPRVLLGGLQPTTAQPLTPVQPPL